MRNFNVASRQSGVFGFPLIMKTLFLAVALIMPAFIFHLAVAATNLDLSQVIVSSAVPGMSELPLGIQNGPVTGSQIPAVLGGTFPALQKALYFESSNTQIYKRSWATPGSNADGAIVIAIQMPDRPSARNLLNQIDAQKPIGGQATSQSAISVSGIPGAVGYQQSVPVPGANLSVQVVVFRVGPVVFEVYVESPFNHFKSDTVLSLAEAQYQQALTFIPAVPISSTTLPAVASTVPIATNTSSGLSPALIFGAAAVLVLAGLAGLIFYLKRRKKLQKNLWEERGLPKALTLAQREAIAREELGLDPYRPPNINDQNITGR